MNESILYLPGLSPVAGKDICAWLDGGCLLSDGGVLRLREIESEMAVAEGLSSCVKDERDPASTTHTFADMIRVRRFAIGGGDSR